MTVDRGRGPGLLTDALSEAGRDSVLRELARLAPVGIVLFDAAGQCTFVNDRWCDWTGIAREDALGSGWADAVHPDDIARIEEEGTKAVAAGAELRSECRLVSSVQPDSALQDSGQRAWRWIDFVATPLTRADGEISGYLAAVTDVTERRRQLAEMQELDEVKTAWIEVASHELRTPLSSIISFIDLILTQEKSLSAESREFLGIIERSAEHVLRLIGDLMLLSGLETGLTPLHVGGVQVPRLVSDAVATGSVLARRKSVTLTGTTGDGPPARGDQLRLRQVLDNLVSNAVKFSQAGGAVTVRADREGRFWRIEVQDQGIGIPADEVDRLFLRFFRATNALASGTQGTGIGLSIVKTITDLHNGRVEVRSSVGQGSAFIVFIPVWEAA